MFGFGGTPGGSPGPDAEGTWRGLIFVTILSLALAGALLWAWYEAVQAAGL